LAACSVDIGQRRGAWQRRLDEGGRRRRQRRCGTDRLDGAARVGEHGMPIASSRAVTSGLDNITSISS
jgi:hypothetical protein